MRSKCLNRENNPVSAPAYRSRVGVLDEEIPNQPADLGAAAAEIETVQQQSDEINLDDALDDDNENPVSHTLIEAAENRGEKSRSFRHKLEGEAGPSAGALVGAKTHYGCARPSVIR